MKWRTVCGRRTRRFRLRTAEADRLRSTGVDRIGGAFAQRRAPGWRCSRGERFEFPPVQIPHFRRNRRCLFHQTRHAPSRRRCSGVRIITDPAHCSSKEVRHRSVHQRAVAWRVPAARSDPPERPHCPGVETAWSGPPAERHQWPGSRSKGHRQNVADEKIAAIEFFLIFVRGQVRLGI